MADFRGGGVRPFFGPGSANDSVQETERAWNESKLNLKTHVMGSVLDIYLHFLLKGQGPRMIVFEFLGFLPLFGALKIHEKGQW